jgi:hypothetical protein
MQAGDDQQLLLFIQLLTQVLALTLQKHSLLLALTFRRESSS